MLVSACSPIDQPRQDLAYLGKPIYYGTPDTSQAHQAVVYIQIDLGGGYGAACTGTLIARDIVLTASHCVCGEGSSSQLSASAFDVFFGNSTGSMYASRSVSEVHKHPNYNPNWYYGAPTNDIAVLRLSSAAPSSVDIIPALPQALGMSSSDLHNDLEYVGFGKQETGASGVKEYVYNALDTICSSSSGCNLSGGGIGAPHTLCSDQNPGGPCSGDSGGPAFLTRGGQEYVVGVTSYGDQNCTAFGCSTQVDYFQSFISGYVGGANGAACAADGECDSGICADGICCSSSCTGECESCAVAGHLGSCYQVPNGTSCADYDKCNGTETCQNGSCTAGSPPNCDDGNYCTRDECFSALGCRSSPVADGISCSDDDACNGIEACLAGVCTAQNTPHCDDGNPCTRNGCDAQLGCTTNPVMDGLPCDLGPCGSGACEAGVCTAGGGALCDDGLLCTEDVCDQATGCQHRALNCDDGNPCTRNECDAQLGCTSNPVMDGLPCDLGLCGSGACQAGVCTAPGGAVCDDGLPCTEDICDPAAGCRHDALPDGYACGDCQACQGSVCAPVANCNSSDSCDCASAPVTGLRGWWLLGLFALGLSLLRRR